MEVTKPQYVEVAEVLGCHPSEHHWDDYGGRPKSYWSCTCKSQMHNYQDGAADGMLLEYNTDWSASGPLIEKLEVDLAKHRTGKWEATVWLPLWFRGAWKNPECVTGVGVTPLLAFCDLMLRLKREPEVLEEVLKRLQT